MNGLVRRKTAPTSFSFALLGLVFSLGFFAFAPSVSATTKAACEGKEPDSDGVLRAFSCVSLQGTIPGNMCGANKPDSTCDPYNLCTGSNAGYCYQKFIPPVTPPVGAACTAAGNTCSTSAAVCGSLKGTVVPMTNNGDCLSGNVCCKPSTSGGSGAGSGTGAGAGTPPATPPGFENVNGITFPANTGLPDPQGGILQIVDNFFSWLLALFAILSIGAFIISGLQYLLATGDDKMIQTAKTNMKWSVVGIAVGLSGYLILKAVSIALTAEYNVF